LVEQYEAGYCKVCGAILNLAIGESRASKANKNAQVVAFILGLPKTPTEEDFIWVVVDHLMKSAHFIPMKIKDPMDKFAKLYVLNIV
jgi:hypothetical protein